MSLKTSTGIYFSGDLVISNTLSLAANTTSDSIELDGRSKLDIQIVGASGDHNGAFVVESTVDGARWDTEPLTIKTTGAVVTNIAANASAAICERAQFADLAAAGVRVKYFVYSGGSAQTANVTMRARR